MDFISFKGLNTVLKTVQPTTLSVSIKDLSDLNNKILTKLVSVAGSYSRDYVVVRALGQKSDGSTVDGTSENAANIAYQQIIRYQQDVKQMLEQRTSMVDTIQSGTILGTGQVQYRAKALVASSSYVQKSSGSYNTYPPSMVLSNAKEGGILLQLRADLNACTAFTVVDEVNALFFGHIDCYGYYYIIVSTKHSADDVYEDLFIFRVNHSFSDIALAKIPNVLRTMHKSIVPMVVTLQKDSATHAGETLIHFIEKDVAGILEDMGFSADQSIWRTAAFNFITRSIGKRRLGIALVNAVAIYNKEKYNSQTGINWSKDSESWYIDFERYNEKAPDSMFKPQSIPKDVKHRSTDNMYESTSKLPGDMFFDAVNYDMDVYNAGVSIGDLVCDAITPKNLLEGANALLRM